MRARSSKIDDIDILMTLTYDIAGLYDMESMLYDIYIDIGHVYGDVIQGPDDVVINICRRLYDMESMSYDVYIDMRHVYVDVHWQCLCRRRAGS